MARLTCLSSPSPDDFRRGGRRAHAGPFIRPEIRCKDGRKAVVWYDGRPWHLGAWNGTDPIPTPVYRAWLRVCDHLEQLHYARQNELPEPESEHDLTILEAVDQWFFFLQHNRRPRGDLKPDGTLADHFTHAIYRLRPLVALYGDTPALDFSAKHLEQFMRHLADGTWWTEANNPYQHRKKPPKPFAPSYINKVRGDVIRLYEWLEVEGFVPRGHAEHLKNMPAYEVEPKGEDEYQLVSAEDLETTCHHASPVVATMMRIQYATAARPGEICRMQERYFDKRHVPGIWLYKPPAHKTAYRGKTRVIPLNRYCQELLAPLLANRAPDQYIFRPEESHAWWQEERAREAGKDRKTRITPSELRRRAKGKVKRKTTPKTRPFAEMFTAYTYAQAVRRAITKARKAGREIVYWTPYALRHTTLTDVQWKAGEEASAALGGHSRNVNREYAHKQTLRAIRVATRVVRGEDPARPSASAQPTADRSSGTPDASESPRRDSR
jgi:integrase